MKKLAIFVSAAVIAAFLPVVGLIALALLFLVNAPFFAGMILLISGSIFIILKSALLAVVAAAVLTSYLSYKLIMKGIREAVKEVKEEEEKDINIVVESSLKQQAT